MIYSIIGKAAKTSSLPKLNLWWHVLLLLLICNRCYFLGLRLYCHRICWASGDDSSRERTLVYRCVPNHTSFLLRPKRRLFFWKLDRKMAIFLSPSFSQGCQNGVIEKKNASSHSPSLALHLGFLEKRKSLPSEERFDFFYRNTIKQGFFKLTECTNLAKRTQ